MSKQENESIWFKFFWQNKDQPELYQVKETTLTNFKVVQSIRLAMLISLLILWFALFYILVRQTIFYVSFYALTFQIASMLLLSISAGRLVVEKKLLDGMNEKKREEFSKKVPPKMFNKDIDGIK